MQVKWIIITLVVLIFSGCIHEKIDHSEIAIGSQVPAFKAAMSDGTEFDSAKLDSKPLIIVFFNTSCSDCRRELPMVQRLYDDYSESVHFALIAREETATSIQDFWSGNNLTMPYSPQTDRAIFSMFAGSEIPRLYIVSSSGIIKNCFKTTLSIPLIASSIEALL